MKLESSWRHLASYQIKDKIRMWTKLPQIWQFITKNIRKLPQDRQTPGIFMRPAHFTDSWITDIVLVTFQWCYLCITQNLIYSRWRPGWKPTSFTNPWERHLTYRPDALPDGEALYKHAYLNKWAQHTSVIELHCTARHIWEWQRISRHVWCNSTSVQVAPDL